MGKQRLSSRRLDWTIHVLYEDVSLEYFGKQQLKCAGHQRNDSAYKSMTTAIQTAKSQPDSAVSETGVGCAFVTSSSRPAVKYSITGAAEGHGQPKCSCPAGMLGKQCWHTIKLLMVRGAKEHQLLDCLGWYLGSKWGGYDTLYRQMAAAVGPAAEDAKAQDAAAGAATADAVVATAEEAAEGGAASAEEQEGAACAGEAAGRPGRMRHPGQRVGHDDYATMEHVDAAWNALRHEQPTDRNGGPIRQHVLHELQQALEYLRKKDARSAFEEIASQPPVLQPNPDADPADNSIIRKRDCIDSKSRAQQWRAAVQKPQATRTSAQAGDAPSFPKPQPAKKRASVHAELSSAAEAERAQKRKAAAKASAGSLEDAAKAAVVADAAPCPPLAPSAASQLASMAPPAQAVQRVRRERRPPAAHQDFAP